jgi:hypothetical protein
VRDLFRRKSVHLLQDIGPLETLEGPRLAGTLAAGFQAAAPLYRFWIEAVERAARPVDDAGDGRGDGGWDD